MNVNPLASDADYTLGNRRTLRHAPGAVLIVIKPRLAERFLRSFVASARAHFTEQMLRLIAGGAMVISAPSMWCANLFKLLKWLITVTAVALLLLPWRWHHEFGKLPAPLQLRHIKLFALGAFALGVYFLWRVSCSDLVKMAIACEVPSFGQSSIDDPHWRTTIHRFYFLGGSSRVRRNAPRRQCFAAFDASRMR